MVVGLRLSLKERCKPLFANLNGVSAHYFWGGRVKMRMMQCVLALSIVEQCLKGF